MNNEERIEEANAQIGKYGLKVCAPCLAMTKHCKKGCGCNLCDNYDENGNFVS